MLENLHFIRPWWLLGIAAALLATWYWAHRRVNVSHWEDNIEPALLSVLLEPAGKRRGTALPRLVAAALFGIGIESLLGRNAGLEGFRGMLNLKVIWSFTAVVGILWTQLSGGPVMGWAFLGVFGSFHLLWLYYRVVVGRLAREATSG